MANVKIEEYDGVYHCVVYCQSVRSHTAVLHCSQCSSNLFHRSCVKQKLLRVSNTLTILSCHGPAAQLDFGMQVSFHTYRVICGSKCLTTLNSVLQCNFNARRTGKVEWTSSHYYLECSRLCYHHAPVDVDVFGK